MPRQISLIVTDLDNTLFDWVTMWHAAFTAMVSRLETQSGIPREILEAELQIVFQRHGTSEYAFALQELPSLRALHPNEDPTIVYGDAIQAYRDARTSTLRLYPGVRETLKKLKGTGCLVVAFTESMSFYTMARLRKLGLDGLLDYVYCPPDHTTPPTLGRRHTKDWYTLQYTEQRYIPPGTRKPDPSILLGIIENVATKGQKERTIYIGDSLMKDVKMAQDAGVVDVYAQYGTAVDTEAYEVLRRVTHWTKEDVEREKGILAGGEVHPTFVLRRSYDEILNLFEFASHPAVTSA